MKLNEHCCKISIGSIIQEGEHNKFFRLINKASKTVMIYIVDGCLINDDTERCDRMFLVDSEILLVEFKGVAHVKALRQLIQTAETLGFSKCTERKRSFIVSSPSPKTATTYQAELKKLQHRFSAAGLELPFKKNQVIEVTI